MKIMILCKTEFETTSGLIISTDSINFRATSSLNDDMKESF